MIYNNPVDYGIEVTLDMLEELLQYNSIQAVKESTRDITNVTRIKNRFGDRLKILCGVDTLALESLLMGADGWVAGLVCAFPAETVAIYELAKAGQTKGSHCDLPMVYAVIRTRYQPTVGPEYKTSRSSYGYRNRTCKTSPTSFAGSRAYTGKKDH